MDDVAVIAVAVFFGGMGLLALARPPEVVARFGVRLDSVDGRNEVRAVYGGFGLAIAVVLLAAVGNDGDFRNGVLTAVAVALAGMAGGRLVGFAVERPASRSQTLLFFVVELVLAGLLVVGLE